MRCAILIKKESNRGSYRKAELYLTKKQKEYEQLVRTPFHTPCPARYSVLHFIGVLSGGKVF